MRELAQRWCGRLEIDAGDVAGDALMTPGRGHVRLFLTELLGVAVPLA